MIDFWKRPTLSSCVFLWIVFFHTPLEALHVPALNLGLTSFLDGGALVPVKPGYKFEQFLQFYHANRYVDHQGKTIPELKNVNYYYLLSISQLIWTTKYKLFYAHVGWAIFFNAILTSHINDNPLSIKSSGAGVNDFLTIFHLQWNPVMKGDRPLFVHRLGLTVNCPTGKYKAPEFAINPGGNVYYLSPYWAATYFFTPKLATSWRINYLWCSRNPKTHIQAGQTFYGNFSLEYSILKKLYIGLNGYFLKQFANSNLDGVAIPNSQEAILGIGPGLLYQPNKTLSIFTNLYFESFVQNRPKGVKALLRCVKVF